MCLDVTDRHNLRTKAKNQRRLVFCFSGLGYHSLSSLCYTTINRAGNERVLGTDPTVCLTLRKEGRVNLATELTGERTSHVRQTVLRLTPFAVVILLLVAWSVASKFSTPMAIPSPWIVFQALSRLLSMGYAGQTFGSDIIQSITRIGIGFLAAVVVGVPIGVLMAKSDFIFQAIDPILQFIRPIPPLAYIPLLVVWFGIGESSKDILIALGTVPIIIINSMAGVRSTPIERIRVAQCLGATPMQQFWFVLLPSALPMIFTGMRVGIGVAWTCLVASEMIAASAGLGWLIQDAGQELQTPIIFIGIVTIGLLGYSMELIIRGVERLLIHWHNEV